MDLRQIAAEEVPEVGSTGRIAAHALDHLIDQLAPPAGTDGNRDEARE